MKKEYYEIYKDLYDLYRYYQMLAIYRLPWSIPFFIDDIRPLRWVSEAIEKAISELGLYGKLRPDAMHFLLINLHQMVVLPITHRDNPVPGLVRELPNMIFEDTRTILSKSKELAVSKGEVTGGDVLQAVNTVWGTLILNRQDIWGGK